ncbi:MAG: zinc-dependent metalloprotease [Bdellovibrionales bacterium]|nr:zinc-dependent metalloprotease [Bdellovibrionales bacterium]
MMKKLFFSAFIIVFALSACNKNESNPAEPKKEVQPDPKIEVSYAFKENLAHANGEHGNRARVFIHKNALEKEFLLQAEVITQSMIPMFENLKSRVVMFSQRDGRLFLFENTKGLTVTDVLEQDYLITEFPILSESSDGYLEFDFNQGMKKLFVMGDWRAHENTPKFEEMFKVTPLSYSYIHNVKFNNKNQFVIQQVAQTAGEDASTVRVKYYLSPYQPDLSFEPTRAPFDFNKKGYFEASPLLTSSGNPISFSTKFNHKKTIVYAISANTPQEYRQAIRDAVLYWNKSFGSKVVDVIDAPQGVTAPNSDYNVIQWVPWDSAGFAYADAQMDPRTGEILHAQVYFTSVFGFKSKFKAKLILNQLKNFNIKNLKRASLMGFQNQALCDMEVSHRLVSTLTSLLSDENMTDEKILEASKDYIREVVSHEVGHTLGLRHNFAGSLATNYPVSERPQIMSKYLNDQEAPAGLIASSSVMEYNDFLEAMIIGDQIEKSLSPLSYDEKAIRYLYYKNDYDTQEWPLFCTDEHTLQGFTDCQRFDVGRSLAEFAQSGVQEQIDNVPYTLMQAYIQAKAKGPDYPSLPVDKVTFDIKEMAKRVLASRQQLLTTLTSEGKLLKVHRQFAVVDSSNEDRVKDLQQEVLHQEMKDLGGFDKIVSPIEPGFAQSQYEVFETILNSGRYSSGTGPYGDTYEFSENEKSIMKSRVKDFYIKFEEELIKLSTDQLNHTQYVDNSLNQPLADSNLKFLESYAFSTTNSVNSYSVEVPKTNVDLDQEIAASTGDQQELLKKCKENREAEECKSIVVKTLILELPEFRLKQELRKESAKLLSSEHSESIIWNLKAKEESKKSFEELLGQALKIKSIEEVKAWDLSKFPSPAAQWILENQTIYGLLAQ